MWYVAVVSGVVGLLAVARPIRRLRLGTRGRALGLVLVAAAVLAAHVVWLPARQTITPATASAHDALMPEYHFRERHVRSIGAPLERVRAAIDEVTAGEIALFIALTTIRRLGRPGPESILNAPAHQPVLEVATRSGVLRLAETDREVVLGTLVVAPPGFTVDRAAVDARWFRELAEPGVVKATINL